MARLARSKLRRPSPSMLVALAALILAMGGFAVAAIPGSDGTVTACYKKKGGKARVVDEGKRCKRGERRLAWNQEGRPGEQGQRGEQGEQGPPGAPDTSNFYDKAQSDARFLGQGAQASDAATVGGLGPAAFLQRSGDLRMYYSPMHFEHQDEDGTVTMTHNGSRLQLASTDVDDDKSFVLGLDYPVHAFGVDLRLESVEVCFETTNSNVIIDQTSVLAYEGSSTPTALLHDLTDRSTPNQSGSDVCYSLSAGAPPGLAGKTVWLLIVGDWAQTTQHLFLGRVTATFGP